MTGYVQSEYYSIGGNRHSAAADWSRTSGLIAFGADQNVALWRPLDGDDTGVSALLSGHVEKVTAVKFLLLSTAPSGEVLITGSADGETVLWEQSASDRLWHQRSSVKAHDGSVNTVADLADTAVFVTGGADATVKLWKVRDGNIDPLATLKIQPRFIPLSLALGKFKQRSASDTAFLAVGGTRNDIQIYAIESASTVPQVKLSATLSGHEGWIRSLSLVGAQDESDLFLASTSHDKYVRLWRFQEGDVNFSKRPADPSEMSAYGGNTLTAKVQTVSVPGGKYSITFEALLLGHEDWIYSASWNPAGNRLQLLTASADGSLAVWEPDPWSGVWVSTSRLGEISGQKGATTATGSSGGFWFGLWAPDGQAVTCVGRTGSWRLWKYAKESQFWQQKHAITGHIGPVNGICWSPDGGYLLSTSSDQTTRLHAEWRRDGKRTWHEFARPQIHGYDLNCITSTRPYQFVSGADEKLLRVFDEPKDIAAMLDRLCQLQLPSADISLPDTAAIPVLGLSNKAVDGTEVATSSDRPGEEDPATGESAPSLLDINEPPIEDLLARHTLWPEREKLYGHGYEISEAATSVDGKILATACKASSIDHAVIRLYDTDDWHEMKPPLVAHSLTVTRLALMSYQHHYLLSVGRDRQWAVFRQSQNDAKTWSLLQANQKAHSRMILDAAWCPDAGVPTFVTAGRDKAVKIWSTESRDGSPEFSCQVTITRKSPVTAVSCTGIPSERRTCLAVGEEDGSISVHVLETSGPVSILKTLEVESRLCPSKSVHRLAWRPNASREGEDRHLAVASADGSVRIFRMDMDKFCKNS